MAYDHAEHVRLEAAYLDASATFRSIVSPLPRRTDYVDLRGTIYDRPFTAGDYQRMAMDAAAALYSYLATNPAPAHE